MYMYLNHPMPVGPGDALGFGGVLAAASVHVVARVQNHRVMVLTYGLSW